MTLLPLEAAQNATDTSGLSTIIISIVLLLAMIGVIGYLAWRNRKDQK